MTPKMKSRKRKGPQLSKGPKAEVTVPVVRAHQSPLNDKQWLVTLECGHERWITSDGQPKAARCHVCEAEEKNRARTRLPGTEGGGVGGGRRPQTTGGPDK